MEDYDSFLGAQAVQSHLEPERFIHRFSDEVFDGIFPERRQHVFIETAAEAFGTRKANAFQFKRLGLFQHHDVCRAQYFLDLFLLSALMVVITEYGDDRNTACTEIGRELIGFLRQAKVREVSA